MKKMKAIVKLKPDYGAEMVEVDRPIPGENEALIKIKATSVCGTDVHIYTWDKWSQSRIKTPQILGHEFAGEVVEIGSGVRNIKIGDYVSGETHIPCQNCLQCLTGQMHICSNVEILGVDRNGSFAEYITVPEVCCWKNAASLSPVIASIQEPFGNATYTVMESRVSLQRVGVVGDGPIAAFAVGISRAVGAAKIYNIGMQDFNLDICRKMGADYTYNVMKEKDYIERILESTNGGVDVVLDMAGNEKAVADAFAMLRRGGSYTAFGIPPEPIKFDLANNIIFKGANIIGINGRKMFETWIQISRLLNNQLVDPTPVITHTMPFSKAIEGLELAADPTRSSSKIVFYPMPGEE